MTALLKVAGWIDRLNGWVGRSIIWLVLVAVLVSATNAVVRKVFSYSSNAFLELQWYLFAAIFLLGAAHTLQRNEHIRIDVIAGRLSRRTQAWIDVFGTVAFLLPMVGLVAWLSWPVFLEAWQSGEVSNSAGGLLVWPARLLVPVGFALLGLQGLAELIKRLGFLMGRAPDPLALTPARSPEAELIEVLGQAAKEKGKS